jgi:hypothetical protein
MPKFGQRDTGRFFQLHNNLEGADEPGLVPVPAKGTEGESAELQDPESNGGGATPPRMTAL